MNTIVKVLLLAFILVLSIMHKRVNPSDFPLLKAQNIGYKITLKIYEFIISAHMHTYA